MFWQLESSLQIGSLLKRYLRDFWLYFAFLQKEIIRKEKKGKEKRNFTVLLRVTLPIFPLTRPPIGKALQWIPGLQCHLKQKMDFDISCQSLAFFSFATF